MSYNLVDSNVGDNFTNLLEGIVFIENHYPYYDKDKLEDTYSNSKYSIQMIQNSLNGILEIDEFYNVKAEGVSFDTIVASGENTSKPHAVPTDRKIQEKDIITIDMGCKVNGYCSDMTRTFFVGEILEEVKPIYDLVLKNQVQTMQDFKDGVSTRLLTKMVENDFKLHNYDLMDGKTASLLIGAVIAQEHQ